MHTCTPGPINLKSCLYQLQSALKQAIEERGAMAMAETSEVEHESIFEDLLGLNSEQCGSSSANPSYLVPEPVVKVMRSICYVSTLLIIFVSLYYTVYNDTHVTNCPPPIHGKKRMVVAL